MSTLIRSALSVGAFILAAGCSSTRPYYVRVDSLLDPRAPEKRVHFTYPGLQGTSPHDLLFLEFKSYVDTVLQDQASCRWMKGPRRI